MSSRNEALENILAKTPDEPASYLVYGDWLSGQGDPRGELIAVQHALSVMNDAEKEGVRGKELAQRERAILEEQRRFLPDVPPGMVHTIWRWGFVETVHFDDTVNGGTVEGVDVIGIASRFFASPVARVLRSLEIGVTRWGKADEDVPAILSVAGASAAGQHIRRVDIGKADDVDAAMYSPGKLDAFARYFPALESLVVYGSEFALGPFNLPNLRTLIIKTCGFTREHLRAVLDAKWPALEHVELWFGSHEYGGDCDASDLGAILEGSAFPKVQHLGLRNAEFTDDLPKALAGSNVLRALKTLDLSKGTMGGDGAHAILEARDAFQHLDSIDVDENFLSDDVLEELRAMRPTILTTEQNDDPDRIPDDRYVSMHE